MYVIGSHCSLVGSLFALSLAYMTVGIDTSFRECFHRRLFQPDKNAPATAAIASSTTETVVRQLDLNLILTLT